MAILTRQAELRSLPEGALFEVPLKARWQPPPKKKHGKANQRGKTSAEIVERAADVAVQELQKERQEEARKQKEKVPAQPSGGVDLSQYLIQNEEPADDVDKCRPLRSLSGTPPYGSPPISCHRMSYSRPVKPYHQFL